MLVLDSPFFLSCAYNISLVVNGFGNQTYTIIYYQNGPTKGKFLPINFYVTFITDPLSAGIYLIEVYWKSYVDAIGDNFLELNNIQSIFIQNPRSLTLLE